VQLRPARGATKLKITSPRGEHIDRAASPTRSDMSGWSETRLPCNPSADSAGTRYDIKTALAYFVPARRASRIDPMIALQHE